jgi:hypothetical protein
MGDKIPMRFSNILGKDRVKNFEKIPTLTSEYQLLKIDHENLIK